MDGMEIEDEVGIMSGESVCESGIEVESGDGVGAKGKAEGVSGEIAFEEAMERLEAVSARLSGENVPLDEAISLYEQGVAYYEVCRRKLDDANRRIMVIEEGMKLE